MPPVVTSSLLLTGAQNTVTSTRIRPHTHTHDNTYNSRDFFSRSTCISLIHTTQLILLASNGYTAKGMRLIIYKCSKNISLKC